MSDSNKTPSKPTEEGTKPAGGTNPMSSRGGIPKIPSYNYVSLEGAVGPRGPLGAKGPM